MSNQSILITNLISDLKRYEGRFIEVLLVNRAVRCNSTNISNFRSKLDISNYIRNNLVPTLLMRNAIGQSVDIQTSSIYDYRIEDNVLMLKCTGGYMSIRIA